MIYFAGRRRGDTAALLAPAQTRQQLLKRDPPLSTPLHSRHNGRTLFMPEAMRMHFVCLERNEVLSFKTEKKKNPHLAISLSNWLSEAVCQAVSKVKFAKKKYLEVRILPQTMLRKIVMKGGNVEHSSERHYPTSKHGYLGPKIWVHVVTSIDSRPCDYNLTNLAGIDAI
ncbi:hypothetical protein K438DRAFT_1767039 [Mycena galopus ATCC 62051]|nr:hypothetical protein K438DRAFT_1767039 [Mycena galopus ATCC 62051]